jgi:hypothetical protein
LTKIFEGAIIEIGEKMNLNKKYVLLVLVATLLVGGIVTYNILYSSPSVKVEIISPKGGEKWPLGEMQEVRWRCSGIRDPQYWEIIKLYDTEGTFLGTIIEIPINEVGGYQHIEGCYSHLENGYIWKVGEVRGVEAKGFKAEEVKIKVEICNAKGETVAAALSEPFIILAP